MDGLKMMDKDAYVARMQGESVGGFWGRLPRRSTDRRGRSICKSSGGIPGIGCHAHAGVSMWRHS